LQVQILLNPPSLSTVRKRRPRGLQNHVKGGVKLDH
jgi:hypothetical protein